MLKKITIFFVFTLMVQIFTPLHATMQESISWDKRISNFFAARPLLTVSLIVISPIILGYYLGKKRRVTTRIKRIDNDTWEVERFVEFNFFGKNSKKKA